MHWIKSLLWFCTATVSARSTQPTQGISDLVKRRLPNHLHNFQFTLDAFHDTDNKYDSYVVSSGSNGTILVKGNSLSALSSG
jgi:alpha-N-acetylglucosaminidase